MTLLRLDQGSDGFYESTPEFATHDVPDAEWAAYKILQNKACDFEDRWLDECALNDEFAELRGILSDEEIQLLKAARAGKGVVHGEAPPVPQVPSTSVAVPPAAQQRLSPQQAAMLQIQRDRAKCPHRHQVGPLPDRTVRCSDCGGILYGNTGVRADPHSTPEGQLKYHDPGNVNPDSFNGTV